MDLRLRGTGVAAGVERNNFGSTPLSIAKESEFMLMGSRFLQFVFPRAEMAGLKKVVFKCRRSLAESFSYFVNNVACTIAQQYLPRRLLMVDKEEMGGL